MARSGRGSETIDRGCAIKVPRRSLPPEAVEDRSTKAAIGSGPQWAAARLLFTVSLRRLLRGRLTGPRGRSEDAELLVDTGATLLVVPRSWAPSRSRAFSWRWILSRSA